MFAPLSQSAFTANDPTAVRRTASPLKAYSGAFTAVYEGTIEFSIASTSSGVKLDDSKWLNRELETLSVRFFDRIACLSSSLIFFRTASSGKQLSRVNLCFPAGYGAPVKFAPGHAFLRQFL